MLSNKKQKTLTKLLESERIQKLELEIRQKNIIIKNLQELVKYLEIKKKEK